MNKEKEVKRHETIVIVIFIVFVAMLIAFVIPKVKEREDHPEHWKGTVDTTVTVTRE